MLLLNHAAVVLLVLAAIVAAAPGAENSAVALAEPANSERRSIVNRGTAVGEIDLVCCGDCGGWIDCVETGGEGELADVCEPGDAFCVFAKPQISPLL